MTIVRWSLRMAIPCTSPRAAKGTTGNMKDPTGQWFEDIYMATRIDEVWTQCGERG